jgi:hypothetical protein
VGLLVGLFVPAPTVEKKRLGPLADEIREQVPRRRRVTRARPRRPRPPRRRRISGQEHAERLKASDQEGLFN